ncbi:hypothetical protein AMS68_004644 [Peltaster fructicola]|uniref:MT-A70-domain-containing protein n=1 Tax=Peltaster fructicola TaxID=286661 RepID=A0A6H0XWI6_9PEZI|nr:hypothetical protein AMS68_004644 [Peltaster fructicola]
MSSAEVLEHILWQSDDRAICLIDGPTSIQNAQGIGINEHFLLSIPATSEPFASQEPKTEASRQRLLTTAPLRPLHVVYAGLLTCALSRLQAAHTGAWLLPRTTKHDGEDSTQSTKSSEACEQHLRNVEAGVPVQDDWPFVSNETASMTLGVCQDNAPFLFPSHSTFMLADCADRTLIASFHANIRAQASENDTPWRFDCIIMDPPWSNRSAKRKRGSYKTAEVSQVCDMLHLMDLDRLMSTQCLVAVWITNKESVREAVLGGYGLFQAWGVELVEEWLWLKVTTRGEPITAIDALWRKPYEVLLLGRRHELLSTRPRSLLKRRVLVSVPDVHSRKPCLKSLIEPMMHSEARILEVFARHLVAGWWSWGNECTKFNQTGQWQKH